MSTVDLTHVPPLDSDFDPNEQMKPWQKNIPLKRLLRWQEIYTKYHNQYALSPFSAVKKHTIAAAGETQRFVTTPEKKTYAFHRVPVKVSGTYTMYGGEVPFARKLKGDVVIQNIAADWHDPAWVRLLAQEVVNPSPVFVRVWGEDKRANYVLEKFGGVYLGSKFTSFAEIYSYYIFGSEIQIASRKIEVNDEERYALRQFKPQSEVEFQRALIQFRADVLSRDFNYTDHYSNYNAKRAWSALSLRGFNDDPADICKPIEMNDKWKEANPGWEKRKIRNTLLRTMLPSLEPLLKAAFPAGSEYERIRLMRLKPGGGELRRHTDQVDPDAGIAYNVLGGGKLLRIHIPLQTNPGVVFTSWTPDGNEQNVHMPYGSIWYLDTRKPHRAINGGDEERIHLVIDLESSEEVVAQLA